MRDVEQIAGRAALQIDAVDLLGVFVHQADEHPMRHGRHAVALPDRRATRGLLQARPPGAECGTPLRARADWQWLSRIDWCSTTPPLLPGRVGGNGISSLRGMAGLRLKDGK